jgi:hypothetical protein
MSRRNLQRPPAKAAGHLLPRILHICYIWAVDFLAGAPHYQQLGVDSLLSNRPGFLRQGLVAESILMLS